jgi:O-antigen/teichoic acid export membrane protein
MRYEVLARSVVEPFAATAGALAAWLAGFTATGLLIGYWAGTLFALGFAAIGVRHCFGALELRRYRLSLLHLRAVAAEGAVPTVSDGASALFVRLDLYLVGLFLGEAPAGVYNVARQVRTPIRQVRQSFDGLLTPLVARTLATSGTAPAGRAVASAARLILVLQLPALVGLAVAGLPLLHWFGPEFAAGYWALLLLAAAETIQGAFGIGDLILLYRQPMLVLRLTLAMVAVQLSAGALLVPQLGVTGAALSVLAAILTGALIRRLSLRREFGVKVPVHYSLGPLVAAAAALGAAVGTALMVPAGAVGTLLALAVALGAYAAALRMWLAATGDTLALVEFRTE